MSAPGDSRAGGGKPATPEARQVAEAAARVTAALGGRPLSANTAAALSGLRGTLGKVSQAYGISEEGGGIQR